MGTLCKSANRLTATVCRSYPQKLVSIRGELRPRIVKRSVLAVSSMWHSVPASGIMVPRITSNE